MTHDIHVYPIFRVKLTGMQGTPAEMVEAAEWAVGTALNTDRVDVPKGKLDVTGHGHVDIEFADGFDASLVDVMDGKRVMRSFTQSQLHDTAEQHAETLDSFIDGEGDDLGLTLSEIRDFLRTIR